jgi:hypothetical protein
MTVSVQSKKQQLNQSYQNAASNIFFVQYATIDDDNLFTTNSCHDFANWKMDIAIWLH